MNGLGLSVAKGDYPYGVSPDQNWWVGDGVNDYITGNANTPYMWSDLTTQDLSLSLWVRIDSTSKKNQTFFSLSDSQNSIYNMLIFTYDSNLNTLTFRVRFQGSNTHRTFGLHDNSSATGITSSSTGWTASTRGNSNSDGFTNLTVTFDASSGGSGIKIYWDNQELTTEASVATVSSKSNWNPDYLAIGEIVNTPQPSGYVLGGAINEVKIYDKILSSSEISDIYNNGNTLGAEDSGVTSGLITEWGLNNSVTDSENKYNSTNNGGTFS